MIQKHFNKNLIMSAEEEERFQVSNICWIFDKLFDVADEKVRDHCHITGKYRGAVHWSCNVNLKMSKKVPVIFHNLEDHESHLIIKELGKFNVKISAILNGLEKYMAFTINRNVVSIDSMQFMKSSLDSLVRNLIDKDFKYLSEEFSRKLLELVKEKGVYPYEYMGSFKKFSEDKLPNKCEFFSSLKDKYVSEKDYSGTANVWNTFKIKTPGDYHGLYLKTDVLLLADVFEKFIKTCLNYYGLDRCHYFSVPGLSWDAMLKMTGVKLQLISDIDMHLFIEKGLRCGISYIAKRHSKGNNQYIKRHDSSKENKTINYWDANNLYGWGMSQPLPYSEFDWLTKKEINKFCLDSISENSPIGYILEVDIEYPDELHDMHNDYPLTPEKLEITQDMLSCSDIADKYGINVGGAVNKLVPNLRSKSEYVVHYRNLQLYLSSGMKLSNIFILES